MAKFNIDLRGLALCIWDLTWSEEKQRQVKIDEDAGIEAHQPLPVKLVALLLLCFAFFLDPDYCINLEITDITTITDYKHKTIDRYQLLGHA